MLGSGPDLDLRVLCNENRAGVMRDVCCVRRENKTCMLGSVQDLILYLMCAVQKEKV